MSLDGCIAGPNGDDGLHNWVFGGSVPVTAGGMTFHLDSEASASVFERFVNETGAVVLGKQIFRDAGENPPFGLPSFVLSHAARTAEHKNGAAITFVSDGIESALAQARAAAGSKDVCIFGGANTFQQYLRAGLIDELQLHLVPKLLGGGLRLFDAFGPVELECVEVIRAPAVTHLRYRLIR
jgi:dihydrofolate reductase